MTAAGETTRPSSLPIGVGDVQLVPSRASQPIPAPRLVGREPLIARAIELVELGSNVLLFGREGCGRTAVLHALARRLTTDGATVSLVDGSGVHDPVQLLAVILRTLGIETGSDADVPSMLAGMQLSEDVVRVIAVDDLEIEAAQDVFGRWRRHLWRFGARWVAVGCGDDPTPYLDADADAWWDDGVLAVVPLERPDARELVARYLQRVGVSCEIPDELLRAARGTPRELLRQARGLALAHRLTTNDDRQDWPPAIPWATASGQPAPYELSPQEARFMATLRDRGSASLADQSLLAELGWSYGKTHGIANALVKRGVLRRSDVPGDLGRPRVVYSAEPQAEFGG